MVRFRYFCTVPPNCKQDSLWKRVFLDLISSYLLLFLVVNTYLVSGFFSYLCLVLSNFGSIHCTKCVNTANIATADEAGMRKDGLGKWLFPVTLMWIVRGSLNCCFCVETQKYVASRKVNIF